ITQDYLKNTHINKDKAQSNDKISKKIDYLDVQVKHVMFEARIVRSSTSFTKELGVKWGILSQGITNNNNLLVGVSETTLWNLREPKKDETTGGYKYTIERPDN
ncbi:type IV pilus secretin PilQ, partial [Acinetobacter baumannii]